MTTTRAHAPEPERRPTPATRAVVPPRSAPSTVMRWQSTAGNAAVAGLLARGGRPPSPAAVVARQEQEEDGEGGSWWSRAAGALRAAMRMKDLLGGVLGRGADVVGSIVRSPVAFLGNLVAGVKGGILRFRANVADHLKRGLMGWLLGALAEGGVQLPATFDAKGIVSMFASLFGLTWNAIRTRVVTRIGEGAMSAVEKGVEVFRLLSGQGIAGLWPMLLARLGNLQEMLLGQVREFVISRVLTAGVTWLIGVLNPAAGIIKALKLIYDIVVFFRENAARLSKLVETVLDSVADVARGSVGTVVTKVESVLGGMVPTLIGFLASVLGLGGIGQRIRGIVENLKRPVERAIDSLIGRGLKVAEPIIRRAKALVTRPKRGDSASPSLREGPVLGVKTGTIRRPHSKSLEMRGRSHVITFVVSSGIVNMASVEGGLIAKALARRSKIKDKQPVPSAELAALDEIVRLTRKSQELLRRSGVDDLDLTKACDAVVAAVSAYGRQFNREDLDPEVVPREVEHRWDRWEKVAEYLGFVPTNYKSHGAPVYRRGANAYITPDQDGHIGGFWKMATSVAALGSKQMRMGTYDENLKKIGP